MGRRYSAGYPASSQVALTEPPQGFHCGGGPDETVGEIRLALARSYAEAPDLHNIILA